MIEEDPFFPGKNINEDSITDDFLSSITSHWNSTSSELCNGFPPTNDEAFELGRRLRTPLYFPKHLQDRFRLLLDPPEKKMKK
jgi:hypothetical protein